MKKFNEIIRKAKTTILKNPSQVLLVLAKLNTAVKIVEDLAPDGKVDGTTTKVVVQRILRNIVKNVQNPNSGATADALALLDSFDKVTWGSKEFATTKARSIGFKHTINDKLDMATMTMLHSEDLQRAITEIFLDRRNTIFGEIVSKAKTKAATYDITKADGTTETITVPALPAYVAGKSDVWQGIAKALLTFTSLDDEYKAESTPVVFMSQEVALELTQEMGQVFNQEAPIAQTGFKTGMSINGTPVVVDTKIKGRKVYFIDEEAVFFKKDGTTEDVDQKLGTTRYVGQVFYDILGVVDENRVWELS